MSRATGRLLIAALLLAGCGGAAPDGAGGPQPAPAATLEVPFSAEQIRDEWRPGLTLELHFSSPGREEWQRWTVLAADTGGAEIEYQALDRSGQPLGEPRRARSGWDELRDHALFPAAGARRERVMRETVLGSLDGWLYTVEDAEAETVTRLFFADELPGAPVWMETRQGGEVLMAVSQVSRRHAAAPPAADPGTAPAPG